MWKGSACPGWQNQTVKPGRSSLVTVAATLFVVAACVNINPAPTATPAPSTTPAPTAAPTSAPTLAPSSGPSASPSAAPSGLLATLDPALAAQIDAVIAGVPAIRELDALTDVPYEFISRDQFRDDLIELNNEDVPIEVRLAEERLLKRLGLVPDDADLEALILELYGSQVAAFYRPDNGRFYIIERDEPFGAVDKIVVAHEYTHALQDQHFDLEATQISDPFEGDSILGQLGVIEGDASLTSQLWALQNLTSAEQGELLFAALGGLGEEQLADMPLVLRRQLEFPYGEGLFFLTNPFTNDGIYDRGGFDAVDAALEGPPPSTEQILHPEKYDAHEEPVDVEVEDLSAELSGLGGDWTRVYQQTLGELGIQILAAGGEEPPVLIPGLPVDWPHQEVAAGWGGDRLNMYEGPNGAWAIVWQTAWDTEADAAEFVVRANELMSTFDGPGQTLVSRLGPLHMDVFIASDQLTLVKLTSPE